MTNKVYTAIAKKLEELFNRPVVFFDKLPQGFKPPCFFVQLVDSTCDLKMKNRYELVLNFDVVYFPKENKVNTAELNDVATRLAFGGLEYISLDKDLVRGTEMKYEVQDDVLHFYISYTLYVRKPYDRGIKMQKLYQTYGVKEEK